MMTNAVDVESMVKEVSDLITLPEIYLKIRELMDDPTSCLEDFAIVAQTDPGLVASILKIVNSAYFGFAGQIDILSHALNLIGIGQLHDLVLSISAIDSLNVPNDIEKLTLFWQRNIYCGVLSRLIAEKKKIQNSETLFVIGLLHKIGRLILFIKFPKESRSAILQARNENISLTEVETSTFGTDYSQVGKALMSEWNLPIKFQLITGCHTQPDKAIDYKVETKIVHVAHMLANNKYPGIDNYQYLIEQEKFAQLNINEDEMNVLCEKADSISLEMEKMILKKNIN